jgi:hypothetical protein
VSLIRGGGKATPEKQAKARRELTPHEAVLEDARKLSRSLGKSAESSRNAAHDLHASGARHSSEAVKSLQDFNKRLTNCKGDMDHAIFNNVSQQQLETLMKEIEPVLEEAATASLLYMHAPIKF